MLPAKENWYQPLPMESNADMYTKPLAVAKIRLRAVQKLGLSPLAAKNEPILSKTGPNAILNLFNILFASRANILN